MFVMSEAIELAKRYISNHKSGKTIFEVVGYDIDEIRQLVQEILEYIRSNGYFADSTVVKYCGADCIAIQIL